MTPPADLVEIPSPPSPRALAEVVQSQEGTILLESTLRDPVHGRYSLLATEPLVALQSRGSLCSLRTSDQIAHAFGNPWAILDEWLNRFELDYTPTPDRPFPLGGCFGYWGYDLKEFVEPRARTQSPRDLDLPDCWLGFYDSLVVFDHLQHRAWIVGVGLNPDGSASLARRQQQVQRWQQRVATVATAQSGSDPEELYPANCAETYLTAPALSTFTRDGFLAAVARAQAWIRQGDIYQVNLSQRFSAPCPESGWTVYRHLARLSPAPFAAYLNAGDFELISSSPELFLEMHDTAIRTRPIKGTRPRDANPARDAQEAAELQNSEKERAELLMITDLLRNDLGRVCTFGSVRVPELRRLERFAHVHHLVSTVEGTLRPGVSHLDALRACFPGGSITGAPKLRAAQIIDALEPVARGPYTGALGYLGFNGVSQLSILIRMAVRIGDAIHFPAGAGIVADSQPASEYAETLAKARGFLEFLNRIPAHAQLAHRVRQR